MRKKVDKDKGRVGDRLPIAISLAALAVSLVNLYVANFRPAHVRAKVGEYVDLGLLREGNFYASLPVAFANDGSRTAVVTRIALLIRADQEREGYLLETVDYQRLNDDNLFVPESAPGPVVLKGGENVIKQVRFRSPLGQPTPPQLYSQGRHNLALLAWLDDAQDPVVLERLTIILPEAVQANIKKAVDEDAQKAETDPSRVGDDERVSPESRGAWAAGPVGEDAVKKLGGG